VKRLWEAWQILSARRGRKRGFAGQRDKRELERAARMRALGFSRWAGLYGLPPEASAARLGVSARTLGEWEAGWRADRLKPQERGRPAQRTDRDTREQVIAMFMIMGPGVGVPTLQALFPNAARRELEDLARRYRDAHLKRTSMLVHVLRWRRAGSVWAMDYTEPPTPVDGRYVKILVVRDLSSGKTLLSLPVEAETSRSTRDALRALFLEYGVPLVIKSDNGSPFIAEETEKLLAEWGIIALLSPPGTPEYNGACEAGIGSLKTRAHHESARNDRPGEWTCDDVEGARLMANQTGRPWGAAGLTPDEAWEHRREIRADERADFAELVMTCAEEAQEEQGVPPGVVPGPAARASIKRVAISRALVAYGILELRRRRIPLAISSRFSAKIS